MPGKCHIGYCGLDLLVEGAQSLKDKRRVIKSLKEKIRNKFNVAVCEFGDQALWQRSQIGFVTCSNDGEIVVSTIRQVSEFVQHTPAVTLLDARSEIMPAG